MHTTHGFALHIICSLLLVLWATGTTARKVGYSGEMNEMEWASWPPYCQARASSTVGGRQRFENREKPMPQEEVKMWRRRMGSVFPHLHHYCNGILMQFRSKRPIWLSQGGKVTRGSGASAANEIGYTWVRMPQNHPLYAKMGADLLLAQQDAGKPDAAKRIIQTLLENSPQDRYSYTGAADFFRKQGEPAKAIEILELGEKRAKKRGKILADLAQDYYDQQQYEKSREYVRLARSKGLKLVRLGRQLEEKGYPISEK